ncbi:uncharacterized protein LOC128982639 [Macrosteles quadrilineatus]|uniref:uncharacterized protein LOC128982639 n=1 Tax=Macrosteles quadrilineatus TaxID=74068 RepID=UPI0023E1378B|nr:uncharacterized protein LOC128982639 [Macrosteles quadrilineatus]
MTKEELDIITSEKQIWRCPPCAKSRRQSMQAVKDAEEGKASIEQIVFMLEEAKEDRKRMEKDMTSSFEFLHNLVKDQKEALNVQSQKLSEYMSVIEGLKQENVNLSKKVRELEVKLDDSEQYIRSNNVEIHGVPEKSNEDVYETVKTVANALGLSIEREAIDVCHRLGKRTGYDGPPTIIARFVRREDKLNLLQKRRVKRNFNTNDLGLSQPAVPIYINENLCPGRRKVYTAARQAKKDKNYTYLWIRNGKILMRKDQSSSVCVITSMDDVAKL